MNIALLHYACPPVVGGVETVLAQHARLLTANGHRVTVVCGEGGSFAEGVPVRAVPELRSDGIGIGASTESFMALLPATEATLGRLLAGFDLVIAHNLLTMPFNLAATHALGRLAAAGLNLVAWTHDLAAVNPDYDVPTGPVFAALRSRLPGVRYVAVSETRAREFLTLTGTAVDAVVPNGIDLEITLGLTREVYGLLGQAGAEAALLFYPTRILRRKNIELALEILAACRDLRYPARLVVSGAANPHGLPDQSYLDELKRRAENLQVGGEVVWVNERFFVDDAHLRSLYLLADGVLYPTRQEGFGLPPLEAAAFRLPIFCSEIEPLRDHLPFNSVTFNLRSSPQSIAEKIIETLQNDLAYLSRKRLLREHSTQRFYFDHMEPLLRIMT